jgi:hypothetical protein
MLYRMSQPRWILDRDDPRAPPQEIWDRLSPEERAHVVESLPAEVPLELHPPEGDPHGTAPLLFMDELVSRLNAMVTELTAARDAAARRAEELARRVESLVREIERLRKR